MRLIDTFTGRLYITEQPEKETYAILSHRWAKDPPEQSLDDILKIGDEVDNAERERGHSLNRDEIFSRFSYKIRKCCERANQEDIRYVWVDTCCIDKTDSVELTEAINSMFKWYSQAKVCYAFLADVTIPGDNPLRCTDPGGTFRRSEWFKRCWTLQELIAPRTILFFSADWAMIGGKHNLARVIEQITGIDTEILTHRLSLSSVSVAKRMSWASDRVATRKEDEAYSLLGIFNVNMTTIYGEGPQAAFLRLQQKILKLIPDQSIFAWDIDRSVLSDKSIAEARLLLAPSPSSFSSGGSIETIPISNYFDGVRLPVYSITPNGIHVELPFIPSEASLNGYRGKSCSSFMSSNFKLSSIERLRTISNWCIVPLACRARGHSANDDGHSSLLALVLQNPHAVAELPSESSQYTRIVEPVYMPKPYGPTGPPVHWTPQYSLSRVIRLSKCAESSWRKKKPSTAFFYIAHRPSMLPPLQFRPIMCSTATESGSEQNAFLVIMRTTQTTHEHSISVSPPASSLSDNTNPESGAVTKPTSALAHYPYHLLPFSDKPHSPSIAGLLIPPSLASIKDGVQVLSVERLKRRLKFHTRARRAAKIYILLSFMIPFNLLWIVLFAFVPTYVVISIISTFLVVYMSACMVRPPAGMASRHPLIPRLVSRWAAALYWALLSTDEHLY